VPPVAERTGLLVGRGEIYDVGDEAAIVDWAMAPRLETIEDASSGEIVRVTDGSVVIWDGKSVIMSVVNLWRGVVDVDSDAAAEEDI